VHFRRIENAFPVVFILADGHHRCQFMHDIPSASTRRSFLKAATGAVGLTAIAGLSAAARAASGSSKGLLSNGDVVLFQGDSITDAGRDREKKAVPNDQAGLGNGYAWLAESYLTPRLVALAILKEKI